MPDPLAPVRSLARLAEREVKAPICVAKRISSAP